MKYFFLFASGAVLVTGNILAQSAPPTPPAKAILPSLPPNYHVDAFPANIAPTPLTQPPNNIQVYGDPRNDTTHPCTVVDQQDIDELKKAITSNPEAQQAFASLKSKADGRITQPINVPAAQKAPDGSWMWPGDYFQNFWRDCDNNCGDMPALGMAYQLTGDAKYGEYVKKVLLAYADNYNNWGHPKGWTEQRYRSAFDGRLSYQFLNDGCWLGAMGFSYDLIYNLPSWTDKERAHIRDDLFKSVAAQFVSPALGKPDYLSQLHNRSAICAAGVLIAGYATDDQELINDALYGGGGTKEAPTGGTLQTHFGEQGILPDGLWVEGAPAYQTGIASCGLFNTAETLWHHGIDMYRFRNGILKRMLDAAIDLSYPNDKMGVAALHDSAPFSLLDKRGWLNNEIGVPYECGYRRYRDPNYIPIIQNAGKSLGMTVHHGPPSLFLDLPPASTVPPRPVESVNFYAIGYGVLRLNTPNGPNQLLQEYGPSAGHAHPSKLGIDLYALGDVVMPFPGVIFPYNDPRDGKWYGVTLSNDVMEVDEKEQVMSGSLFRYPRGTVKPECQQLVYGPASTMGIERAWSNSIFPGVTEDRALFLTPQYLADIYGGFSDGPHKYDLAWHIRGTMTTSLKADPFQFPDPVANGYNSVTNLTHASTDQPWNATVTTPNNQAIRFLAPGGTPTDVFLGNGLFLINNETPPIIVQRRANQNNALFGNAVDISGNKDGYLKSVVQEGSLDVGYGLLKVGTAKGTDLCFSSFRPGSYTAGDLSTDAMQAFVQMDGANVSALYLGGGTTLKASNGSIQRSAPGLAYVEKTTDGSYIVGNPSPTDALVTVTLPALAGLKAHNLDDQGKPSGDATVAAGPGNTFALQMKASTRVAFGL